MTPTPPLILLFLLLSSTNAAVPALSPTSSPSPTTSPSPKPTTPAASSSSPLDPKQQRALMSLNIPTSKNPCSSPTTTCDSSSPFRHLISLTLSNCSEDVSLSLTALKSLSTLTSLSFLNCHLNPIHLPSDLASNLHSFTSIRSLNHLTGVWLSRLDNLTQLTVSDSPITASGPTIILSNMQSLHYLTLSRTNLSGPLPKHWHSNLTSIDLSGNHLQGRIPVSLTRLENLKHLNLSSNSLNETIPTTLGDLSSLQNLSLASNSLSGPIPESLADLAELAHLDLGSNQLNGTIPRFLMDMKSLKFLNLEKNNFHGVLPFNATFMKRVEVIRVGENSNLCYNRSVLGAKVKLGIAPCDRHGLPMSPPPSKDMSADDSGDSTDENDYGNVDEKKHHNGPNKVVLGFAIGISSIVFLIVFLVCLSRCCK